MEVLHIKHGASPEYQSCEICCPEGCSKLFLHKHWPEIVRVDASVVLIPLFGIDVPASSEGIRFHAKPTRVKADNHVELGEKLRPLGLLAGQEFSCCEVLEVLVVGNNVDQRCRAFQVMPPGPQGLMNGQQFLHQETFKVLVYLDIYGQVIISLMLVNKCIYSIVCLKS